MYSEIPPSEDTTTAETPAITSPEMPALAPAETPTVSSTGDTTAKWQQYGEQLAGFLDKTPSYVTDTFNAYRTPIITLGLLLGALVALKLTLALLDAINDLPLLDPTLDLIGLGYTAWFVNRYLLRASTRQELAQEINNLKEQFFGGRS